MSPANGSAPAGSGPAPPSHPPFVMPFAPGQVINGKYEVVELIGVGGLGFVVAALHVELGEKVALKFLRPEALSNAEAVGRFAREARASVKLRSEHVARVLDVGALPNGAPFIVMEHLDGSDLGVLLRERGPLPVPLAVEYVLQTCEALATAHASGVVHRDIKPDNLFLNRRAGGVDVIKVLDFGISKVPVGGSAHEIRHPLVETTMAVGSPIYMSPEQLRGSKHIDARTDIWSLGCVLYELLTNRLVFDASSITEVTALILECETPSLRSARPDVPPELEALIERCLAKQPDQRFQNVAELALALAPFASPRGRTTIERCCAIVRGSGSARQSVQQLGSMPPPLPPSVSAPGDSAGAASTATVEAPLRRSRAPASAWPLALVALVAAAGASGAILARSQLAESEAARAPLVPPPAAASAPAPMSPVASAPTDPSGPASPPANTAAAAPEREPEPKPSEAAAGASSTRVEAATKPVELPPTAAPAAGSPAPTPGSPAASEATQPVPRAAPAGATSAPSARADATKARAPAEPRRRINVAAPKPRSAPAPRVSPVREEPDIGF